LVAEIGIASTIHRNCALKGIAGERVEIAIEPP
jgi:hypothetical protein